jgi:hypothetical protein
VSALALALLLGAADGPPDAAAAEARAEPAQRAVRLGEPFDYAVALRHAPDEVVELLPPADLGPFGLRGSSCRTTAGERSAVTVCTLSLQLFALGEHRGPALTLRLRGPAGERQVVAGGAPVESLTTLDRDQPASAQPLRDPPAPPVMVPSWRLLALAGGALSAALLGLLAWRLWRGRQPLDAATLALPPWERLARRVGEVAALELPQKGRGREHLDRLAEAVRAYLAAVAPQAHLDLTTAELLAALPARPAPGVDRGALAAFLEEADLVKFARAEPAPEACARHLAFARAMAEAGRPPAGEEAA